KRNQKTCASTAASADGGSVGINNYRACATDSARARALMPRESLPRKREKSGNTSSCDSNPDDFRRTNAAHEEPGKRSGGVELRRSPGRLPGRAPDFVRAPRLSLFGSTSSDLFLCDIARPNVFSFSGRLSGRLYVSSICSVSCRVRRRLSCGRLYRIC